jgi:hypothetical protein
MNLQYPNIKYSRAALLIYSNYYYLSKKKEVIYSCEKDSLYHFL